MQQLIRSRFIVDEFAAEEIQNYAKLLCEVDFNILMSSKSLETSCDKVEEWYSTKYSINDFSPELLKKIRTPNVTEKAKKLGLPPPNTLIAENLDVMEPNREMSKFPQLIK